MVIRFRICHRIGIRRGNSYLFDPDAEVHNISLRSLGHYHADQIVLDCKLVAYHETFRTLRYGNSIWGLSQSQGRESKFICVGHTPFQSNACHLDLLHLSILNAVYVDVSSSREASETRQYGL